MRNKYTAIIINHDSNDENLYYFYADSYEQIENAVEESNSGFVFACFEGFLESLSPHYPGWIPKPKPMNIEDFENEDLE